MRTINRKKILKKEAAGPQKVFVLKFFLLLSIILSLSIVQSYFAGSSSPMRLRGIVANPKEYPMKATIMIIKGIHLYSWPTSSIYEKYSAKLAMDNDTIEQDVINNILLPVLSISISDTRCKNF